MNIVYENASQNDSYGIAHVSAHSWKETYTGILPDDYLNDRIKNIKESAIKTKEFIRNYPGEYIVAKDGDNVIGILAYRKSDDNEYKEYGYLEALYILKKYQGYGIGKELFKKAIIGLKNMGYNKMYLECMTGNDTLNFYKKYLGFIHKNSNYSIDKVGPVKVDIILFDDLDRVINII